jgi:hypothetical protein
MGKRIIEGTDPKKDKGKRKIYSHKPQRANPEDVQFNELTRKWEIRHKENT